MSLLFRLTLFGILVALAAGSFWFFEKSKADAEFIRDRYVACLEKSISQPGETIDQLISLLKNNENSDDELILLFELILESPNHSIEPLLSILEEKLIEPSSTIEWEIIGTCVLYRQGEFEAAKVKLGQIYKNNPANRRANYEYQKIRWILGGIEERVAAKLALFEIAELKDRWSYKALRVLAFSSPRPGIVKDDLIRALDDLCSHPLVTSKDFLKASEVLLRVDRGRKFDQVFDDINSMLGEKVSRVDFGYWLIQNGQAQRAMEITSAQESQTTEDLFFIRFQALLETNQTAVAQDLFEQAAHLSESKKLQANAYLQLSKGSAGALNQFLEGAQELNQASTLLDVARLALLHGDGPVAYRAFQGAWKINPLQFNLSQANQFLQVSLSSRNSKEAHQITREIHRRYPEKFGNANNHCYLSLLLGEDLVAQKKEALRITTAFPGNPTFLSTLALAELLNGDPKEALRAMNQRGPVPLNHGEKALLACILEAAGNKEDAVKLANGLEEHRMLPEEWNMLKKYRLVESQ